MDEGEFERTVREQKNRLYTYSTMLLRDPGEAQDIVQEAMLRLWNHRDTVDGPRAPMWLKRTTHNLCIDRLRYRRVRPEVGVEEPDLAGEDARPNPERLAGSGELGREIERAMEKLSPVDRAVLVLREVQQLPYGEIAEMLEMPLGTLKARIHRAREQLRRKLIQAGVSP